MLKRPAFLGRRETAGLALLLLVFAVLVAGLGLGLRSQLRNQLLAQEAASLQALITLKMDADLEDFENDALLGTKEAAFSAVLEASRLRGVVAARLFDENGEIHSALPAYSVDARSNSEAINLAREQGRTSAIFHADANTLETLLDLPADKNDSHGPLIEIAVPVPLQGENHEFFVAHFWLEGASLQTEFTRIDHSLLLQAAIAFLAGSAALAACLLWALRRLGRSNAELLGAREDLLRANEELAFSARTAALGTISAHLLHDLKNPLIGLEGFISDGSSGPAPDGPAWKEAHEAARHLRNLVSETLEVMRQECNHADGSPRPLSEILSDLIAFQAPKAQAAGIQISLHSESKLQLPARTASLLSLALRNLIANAIDASPAGTEVRLSSEENTERLLIDLHDQGPGIAKELLPKLFQPLNSLKQGGHGLGIALSRHLARHAGASLDLLSTGSSGTCFRLCLPLGNLTQPHRVESSNMPPKPPANFHSLLSLALLFTVLCPWASGAGLTDGTQKWAYTTLSSTTSGAITSSPALGNDGTVYFGMEIGAGSLLDPARSRIYALNADGSLKWWVNPEPLDSEWIDSTPAIAPNGQIIVGCWNGKVYALDPATGATKWKFDTSGFVSGSAAIGPDGTIYIGSGSSTLFALNPDGTLKWRFLTSDWIDSAPSIGADGTIYFGCWDNYIYALNPDGTQKWRYLTAGDVVSSPAIAADGTVYVGSRDRNLYALNPDGSLKWYFTTLDTIDSSVALARDGRVCFASADGRVYCLNPDGTEKWRYPAAGVAALQPLYSSPAMRDDGSLIIGSSNNLILCLNADGTLRWSTAMGDWADSSPLIATDGTIYIGCTDKKLYAFNGTQAPINTDWGQYRRDSLRNAWSPMGIASNNSGRISNMSVRAQLDLGQILTVGCWVNGTGSRDFLARAVGPKLADYGISPTLPDPVMKLYNAGGTLLTTNDNWEQAPNLVDLKAATAALTGFALNAGGKDSALFQTFTTGGYTFQISDKSTGAGVALVELYDKGSSTPSRLSNISCKNQVGIGDKVLVTGFYLSGGPLTLLIRGIGPSLDPFGEKNLLTTPRLRVYSGTRLIAESLSWAKASNASQIKTLSASVYAFDLIANSLDAAILITLPAGGPYTAQLDGVSSTTGLGLLEVYELP